MTAIANLVIVESAIGSMKIVDVCQYASELPESNLFQIGDDGCTDRVGKIKIKTPISRMEWSKMKSEVNETRYLPRKRQPKTNDHGPRFEVKQSDYSSISRIVSNK